MEGTNCYERNVGVDISLTDAVVAAGICAQYILYHLNEACEHDLNSIKECISLKGYVNCSGDFTEISQVINGASDTIIEIFGQAGRHVRTAIGVSSLPLGSAVEVEASFGLE